MKVTAGAGEGTIIMTS